MKKQTKQTNEKKFNLEKMEVVKLSSMRKIVGGAVDDGGGEPTYTDKPTENLGGCRNNSKNV